jgi:hypothetical protein
MEARTLVPATVEDFRVLCELTVEAAAVLRARRAVSWETHGPKLANVYRGLVQRLESKMRAFRLAPMGKEMVAPVPAEPDPFAEFDEGMTPQ